ncbi:amidase [Microbacterium sp. ABRD28]|uniref:amidase n=1 Tax=Microbacterium sp. ABRD28 TaxID=2268461 RepID=UPI000F5589BE|nr:amidase [Microbacterium sp. ABRD28]AZC13224.1 amidase [Microbacterium sp. ABRD28]
MPVTRIEELTIADVHDAYRRGTFTARELVQAYLDRIDALDRSGPALNSVISVAQDALAQADRLDAELARTGELVGPLHGVPVAVKDQIETADIPTSFGNILAADYLPEKDATAIARLRDAGAIILAKTTLPDFATSWFSTSSRSGITKNPYDLSRDPGGSSSGTATAVAANLALVGIGEDTGGSIRLPASFCGLVGVRVTPGLISRAGMSSLVSPQDTSGPMTRTVADAAALLDVMVGYDPEDSYTGAVVVDGGGSTYADAAAEGTFAGTRLGVLRQAFPDTTDPDGAAALEVIEKALAELRAGGAELIDIEIDRLDEQVGFTSLYTTRSQADMNTFVQARPSLPVASMQAIVDSGDYHEKLDLLEAIVAGPLDPTDDEEYLQRVLAQPAFQRQVLGVMAEHDLDAVVFPDAKLPAPTHADVLGDRWTCLTYPTNTVIASQLLFPAITVPAGHTTGDLPVGLEIMAPPYAERPLIGIAAAVEATLGARRAPRAAVSDV